MIFAKLFYPPGLGQVLALNTINEQTGEPAIYLYSVSGPLLSRRVRNFPASSAGRIACNLAFDLVDEAHVVAVLSDAPTFVTEAGHA